MMPVPLFFAGVPPEKEKKIDFDPQHKDLSLSFLSSPYDQGLVLASPKALIFIRARLAWQKDWVAVDFHLYNVYGPPINTPPTIAVRVDGGEQLDDLPIEHADKLIPDNTTFGEYESNESSHSFGGGASVPLPWLGIGISGSYTYTTPKGKGTSKHYSQVNPLAELFSRAWQAKRLEEGAFKRGLILFKLPRASPRADSSRTIILKFPLPEQIAHLKYRGKPAANVEIPGSVIGAMRYAYSTHEEVKTKP